MSMGACWGCQHGEHCNRNYSQCPCICRPVPNEYSVGDEDISKNTGSVYIGGDDVDDNELATIVHAIRNNGWCNGFNTDDAPWIDRLKAWRAKTVREACQCAFEDLLQSPARTDQVS